MVLVSMKRLKGMVGSIIQESNRNIDKVVKHAFENMARLSNLCCGLFGRKISPGVSIALFCGIKEVDWLTLPYNFFLF